MKRTRIGEAFAKAKRENRGAFVAYLTMGFPTLAASERAVGDVIAAGADVVELGVPFSDPFADGALIRSAAVTALAQGVTLDDVLAAARRIRAAHPDVAIVLFGYYNVIYAKGPGRFAREAAAAGVDAVLVVDLPLEERDELLVFLRREGLGLVPLVAPNTPSDRVEALARDVGDSFLYAMTVKGTTGERNALPGDLLARLDRLRGATPLPVAAGFGISTRAQAEEVSRHADGFVVGSALVRCVAEGRPPCLN
jgi:tryptophan synthase alpha chain